LWYANSTKPNIQPHQRLPACYLHSR
jgi:hypothetical protein